MSSASTPVGPDYCAHFERWYCLILREHSAALPIRRQPWASSHTRRCVLGTALLMALTSHELGRLVPQTSQHTAEAGIEFAYSWYRLPHLSTFTAKRLHNGVRDMWYRLRTYVVHRLTYTRHHTQRPPRSCRGQPLTMAVATFEMGRDGGEGQAEPGQAYRVPRRPDAHLKPALWWSGGRRLMHPAAR
jgi:hypothetical protein